MKLAFVSSSLSISSILAADFASIPYTLQEAANELSPIFLNDASNFPTEIFDHGCWCGKLNALPSAGLGGNPIDDLDQLCKDWSKARRCSRVNGGTCESASALILSSSYQVEYDFAAGATGTQLCPDSDACLSETCQIDSYYINLIKAWRTANPGTFSPETNPTCNSQATQKEFTCEQFETTARPIDEASVNNALSDAGVDNTGKAIAVTLVWAGAYRCDFDLVVVDPSGEKTYYSNTPSSSGGVLDVDQFGREDVNVENISWDSAPSGTYQVQQWSYSSCTQPEFTVYINVEGVLVNTLTGTSTGSQQVVGSFNYQAGTRSVLQAKKYNGPAQEYGPKN